MERLSKGVAYSMVKGDRQGIPWEFLADRPFFWKFLRQSR